MSKLYIWLMGLLRGERGQDMVEYALITVVISAAIVLATVLILEPGFQAWANDLEDCITAGQACPF